LKLQKVVKLVLHILQDRVSIIKPEAIFFKEIPWWEKFNDFFPPPKLLSFIVSKEKYRQ